MLALIEIFKYDSVLQFGVGTLCKGQICDTIVNTTRTRHEISGFEFYINEF